MATPTTKTLMTKSDSEILADLQSQQINTPLPTAITAYSKDLLGNPQVTYADVPTDQDLEYAGSYFNAASSTKWA